MNGIEIVQVGTYDLRGGAGIAASRLHAALRAAGVQSRHLVRYKAGTDPDTYAADVPDLATSPEGLLADVVQRAFIDARRTPVSNTLFTIDYPGIDITPHPVVRHCDLINLHWVSGFLSLESTRRVFGSGKPVVWTLHDEFQYTGGCHYSAGCTGFTRDCESCPQLRDDPLGIAPGRLRDRIAMLRDAPLTIVCPSEWIRQRALRSTALGPFRSITIPNSVPIDLFCPGSRGEARARLGLPVDRPCILFGSENHREMRKGFVELMEAIESVRTTERGRAALNDATILCFGRPSPELIETRLNVTALGPVDDPARLRDAYRAADLFALPSLEDNLPNTILESLACGTPIVAFDIGGIGEAVIDGATGWLAPERDTLAFGERLIDAVTLDPERAAAFAERARADAVSRFAPAQQAGRYRTLYHELLSARAGQGVSPPKKYVNGFPATDPQRAPAIDRILREVADSALGAEVLGLTRQAIEVDRDRYLRGIQIDELGRLLEESEADRAARGEHMTALTAALQAAQATVADLQQRLAAAKAAIAARPPRAMTIAVDLTPMSGGAENGGARTFAIELIRDLAQRHPQLKFLLLTDAGSHDALATLDRPNVSRVPTIAASSDAHGGAGRDRRLANRITRRIPGLLWRRIGPLMDWRVSARKRMRHRSLLRDNGVDLLFCPFTAPTFAEPGIPTVCTVHDLQYRHYPEFFAPQDVEYRAAVFAEACRRSERAIAVSEYTRQSVLQNSGLAAERVTTIHHRLATRIGSPGSPRPRAAAAPAGRYLLYPADFRAHKNHEMLITAFGIARGERMIGADLHLVLTGAPDRRRDLLMKSVAAIGLQDRIVFPGYLDDEEFGKLLEHCTAVVVPSLFEGFGLAVIEAMAHGKPVACSDATSLPEIAGDAGLLFDPRRPLEIARALATIAENDAERQRLAAAGRRRAADFADISQMSAEYLSVFEQVLQSYTPRNEISGVHSDGWAGSQLQIRVAPAQSSRSVEVELFSPPSTPMAAVALDVEVSTRNADSQNRSHLVRRGETQAIAIPVPPSGASIEIDFRTTFNPAREAINDDSRDLALIVRKCVIVGAGEPLVLYAHTPSE